MSNTLSWSASVSTIVSSTLGLGILFMPATFGGLGYSIAPLVVALMGLVTFFSLYCLAYSAAAVEIKGESSYPGLAQVFSKKLRYIIDACMIGSSLGCVVSFVWTFRDLSADFVCDFLGYKNISRNVVSWAVVITLSVLCFLFFLQDDLSSLSFMSYICVASASAYAVLMFVYGLRYRLPLSELQPIGSSPLTSLLRLIIALHCQFSYLSIFEKMADRSMSSVISSVAAACVICVLLYGGAGMLGYMATGSSVKSAMIDVLMNKTHPFMLRIKAIEDNTFLQYWWPLAVIIGFFFIFFAAIVFNSFPLIAIFQGYFSSRGKPAKRMNVAIGMAALLLMSGAMRVGDNVPVLDVTCALCTNPLSFLFPGLFMMYVSPRKSMRSMLAIGMAVSSFVLAICMLYSTFKAK